MPDLNAIGFAEYGHRRGIFRVLDTLARENVKATMIVSGIMAERHAEIVRRISEAGHDIVAHSYAMDVIPIYLDEDAGARQYPPHRRPDRARDRKAPDRLDQPARHAEPAHRPPAGRGGFEWHGDSLNDDLPYFVHFKAGTVVSFSSNMECNDLPLYMRHGNPPRVMLEIFQDWLDYARKYEQGAARIDPTIHSHVFGRPVGMAVFQRMIEIAKAGRRYLDRHALGGGEVHPGAATSRAERAADAAARALSARSRALTNIEGVTGDRFMGGLRLVLSVVALSVLTAARRPRSNFPPSRSPWWSRTRPAAISTSPRAYCRRRSAMRSVSRW